MQHPIRLAALCIAVALAACEPQEPLAPDRQNIDQQLVQLAGQKIGPGVIEALQRGESPAIIVALEAGAPRALSEMRQTVASVQDEVLRGFTASELLIRTRYQAVPAVAGLARSEPALRRLAADPRVRRIDLDLPGTGSLTNSVPLIQADLRHDRDNGGDDVVVAILDSGIDSDHPDLADALVAEACFGDNNSSIDGVGFCPGGGDRETGSGSGEDDAGHGTHVAGIVASNGTVSGVGVAPNVDIVSIKISDNCSFSGCFYGFSEVVAALDYIINNPQLGVQVINMSIGTNALYNGTCDGADANAMAGAAAVNTLRNNGVTTFASAGNDSSGTQMPLPACIGNVVSVGAVDNNDNVAVFSNSNATTDIFAPGVSITSLAIGGGTTGASGTSMSSPHAAGCAALLIHAGDATTPAEVETRLETSGVQVTDPTNNLTFPRIDCSPDENESPDLTVDDATVTVDEGSVATNSGTISDPDGDPVTLSTSIGTVTDNGDSTWSWSFATTDGPAESQTVTITATDALDAEAEIDFELVVLNVPPDVDAGPDASITSNDTFDFSGSFSDPGVIDSPWDWQIDWGDGTQDSGSALDQALPIDASHQFCTAQDYTVSLSVTDKDGDTGVDPMTLTVEHFPVDIEIKPTDNPNSVNPGSKGMLPVAVLSSASFDATQIDPATLLLGDETDPDTPVAVRNNGTFYASIEDVNNDGLPDLMLHFRVPELVANGDLTGASTSLVLRGFLTDGCTNFRGEDSVNIVP